MPSLVRADAVVNLCHTAGEAGSGTNLRTALGAQPGPNGVNAITFQCNGPATIQANDGGGPLEIFQATSIDGGGNIMLLGFIVVADPGHPLFLYRLTLRNPNMKPLCANCGSVINGEGVTELHGVTIDSSDSPVAVTSGSLGVFDSQFTGNTGNIILATAGVVSITIDQTVFRNNAGAPPLVAAGGNVNITNSQFGNNGLTSVFGACQLKIDGTTFQDTKPVGALLVNCDSTISNSLFANNAGAFGGAILFAEGAQQVTLRGDTFLNNSAGQTGGAVCWGAPQTGGRLSIEHTVFKGNTATAGGAIQVQKSSPSETVLIGAGAVTFSHNVATGDGGAINAVSAALQVARGVFADNNAGDKGGAIFVSNSQQIHSIFANTLFIRNNAPTGSAFYGDDAAFINSTVDSNKGLAIANDAQHPAAHIKFTNAIVSNNPQGGCGPAGLFDDGGHNLQFPGADCGPSISVANPQLDTMYIPLPGSPPMGHGDLNVCMSPPINGRDVYGLGRPSGGACTIGAAEGDIEVLVNRNKRRGDTCECDLSLLQQLQRSLPYKSLRR